MKYIGQKLVRRFRSAKQTLLALLEGDSVKPEPLYEVGQVVLRTYYDVYSDSRKIKRDRTGVIVGIVGTERAFVCTESYTGAKTEEVIFSILYDVHWSTGEVELVKEVHIKPIEEVDVGEI